MIFGCLICAERYDIMVNLGDLAVISYTVEYFHVYPFSLQPTRGSVKIHRSL